MSLNQHRMYNQMLNDMVQKPPEVSNEVVNAIRMMTAY